VKALVAVRGQSMKGERCAVGLFGRFLALGIERVDRRDVSVFFRLARRACALVIAAAAAAGPASAFVARLVGDVVGGAF
jgi:hypothetical protein